MYSPPINCMGGDFLLKRIICIIVLILNMGLKVNAFEISAKSAILYEPITKRIVFEKNAYEKLPMASTTKIITAITAIENMNVEDIVTTSKKAADVEGSSIWLEEGEKQTLENLLYGLMLSSGNDAAIAIADHKGYNDFIKLMNETVIKAGVTNTALKNPSGLDEEGHFTTAYDLAKIAGYAMKNEHFRKIVSTKEKVIPWEDHQWGRTLKNHNKLLRMYEGANGIKTGFTKKDGRCLVSSAERNGVSLICVTLNAPNDWQDHTKLLDFGFSSLENKKIEIDNENIAVLFGKKQAVALYPDEELFIPVMKDDKFEIKYFLPEKIYAPIEINQLIGTAEVSFNGKVIKTVNMYAKEKIDVDYLSKFKYELLNIISLTLT